ncbi:MAG: hypothetical protein NVS9B12_14940 [Vulcanimicrobiaceae bacterium]
MRAAGYRIYVCNDSFIHHFGSATFSANAVDYASTMKRNWTTFASKWGYPAVYPASGYEPARAIASGFDRSKHYVPVAGTGQGNETGAQAMATSQPALLLAAVVRSESDWAQIGRVVRRYLSAFEAGDAVMFAIACAGEVVAQTVGGRVQKMIDKLGIDPARSADVDVSDETALGTWAAQLRGAHRFEVCADGGQQLEEFDVLQAASPSDLRRLYARLESSTAPA